MTAALTIASIFTLFLFNCKGSLEKNVETASETENDLQEATKSEAIGIIPIHHATLILTYKNTVIYVDPVGGIDAFSGQKKPDYILITDIHGDHFDPTTLKSMVLDSTLLILPQAVKDKLPTLNAKKVIVMKNEEKRDFGILSIEAIAMYNLRAEAIKYHEKGRGNGYVLTLGDERVYISGDTEDISEMRALKDIDIALICMNLPYTMTVERAASAVLEFKPKKVYPYHYKGENGMSDIEYFKTLISKENSKIKVVQLDWYK